MLIEEVAQYMNTAEKLLRKSDKKLKDRKVLFEYLYVRLMQICILKIFEYRYVKFELFFLQPEEARLVLRLIPGIYANVLQNILLLTTVRGLYSNTRISTHFCKPLYIYCIGYTVYILLSINIKT